MRRERRRARLRRALLPALLAAALFPAAAAACSLHVAWDPYEPYSYSDGGAAPVGYDIDVVRKVADEIGCSLTFTEMPWNEVLAALESGDADVAIGTGYHLERAAWSRYSESYRKEVTGLLVRAGTAGRFPGGDLDALFRNGLEFGRTTGDTYDDATEAVLARYAGQVHARVGEEKNFRRLLDGSIDGFLIEVNVAAAIAARLDVAGHVAFHPLAFDAGDYRLQMSKATVPAERAAAINAAIQRLAAEGWFSRRLETYALEARAATR